MEENLIGSYRKIKAGNMVWCDLLDEEIIFCENIFVKITEYSFWSDLIVHGIIQSVSLSIISDKANGQITFKLADSYKSSDQEIFKDFKKRLENE